MKMTTSTPPRYFPAPPELARPWPTTVLWRWRYEISLGAGTFLLGWGCGRAYGAALPIVVGAVVLVLVGGVGPLRRAAIRRGLCVVTQHRLRVGLAMAWIHNRDGRLPALLWTRSTADGEAVLLWLPAGICEEHVAAVAEVLRSACWARHVQVAADPRHRQLVTVQVVRFG